MRQPYRQLRSHPTTFTRWPSDVSGYSPADGSIRVGAGFHVGLGSVGHSGFVVVSVTVVTEVLMVVVVDGVGVSVVVDGAVVVVGAADVVVGASLVVGGGATVWVVVLGGAEDDVVDGAEVADEVAVLAGVVSRLESEAPTNFTIA